VDQHFVCEVRWGRRENPRSGPVSVDDLYVPTEVAPRLDGHEVDVPALAHRRDVRAAGDLAEKQGATEAARIDQVGEALKRYPSFLQLRSAGADA
jgi:hypothetical protein